MTCVLCQREESVLLPCWAVCPLCSTWICKEHTGHEPQRRCRNCMMQLQDYAGGGDNICLASTIAEYVSSDLKEHPGNGYRSGAVVLCARSL